MRIPFDLEMAQRVRRDLIDPEQRMPFDATTVASELEAIAKGVADDVSYFLLALADALDQPDAVWRLKLGRARRGRVVTEHEAFVRSERDKAIYDEIAERIEGGWPVEAAVAEQMQKRTLSRSSVFAARRRRETELEWEQEAQP
jgi:hypothetical protein